MTHHKLVFSVVVAAGCANPLNQPQYVTCPAMPGAAPMDRCVLTAVDDGQGGFVDRASIHVPVMPEGMWRADDRQRRAQLQQEMPDPAIEVPVFRLEHYALAVEWVARNLDGAAGEFRVALDGGNEVFAYDPSMIVLDPSDDEAPPPPSLAGNIPLDIGPDGQVSGVFREDQLEEAAIDLDQISRGEVNPFNATLSVNRSSDEFQPLTPATIDPATGDVVPGVPTGPAVPRAAFRQLVRLDVTFRADRAMELELSVRVREHVDVVHEEGLSAPAAELSIIDPPIYVPAGL